MASEGEGDESQARGDQMSKVVKIVLGLAILGSLVMAFFFLPLNDWLLAAVEWIHGAGAVGVAVYFLMYVGFSVAMLPGSVLTLGAGFAWGPLWGVAVVSPASVLAATVAFLLGRTLLRDWVQKRVAQNPKFSAIDRAVGENGFKIVFLLRLSPIFPFNLLNYGLGLTRVPVGQYVAASFLGMLPGTFLYVYIGSLVTSVSQLFDGSGKSAGGWGQALYWGGLVATLVVTVLVTRIAKKALNEAVQQSSAANETQEVTA